MIAFKNASSVCSVAFFVLSHNNPKQTQDIVFSLPEYHFILFSQVGTNEFFSVLHHPKSITR